MKQCNFKSQLLNIFFFFLFNISFFCIGIKKAPLAKPTFLFHLPIIAATINVRSNLQLQIHTPPLSLTHILHFHPIGSNPFPLIYYFALFWISVLLDSREMSKAGALDLATGLGGKIDKSDVLSAVEKYSSSFSIHA